ncbi:MAG TPA: hypothetical protein VFP58_10515 [Candidatus Eisenbacteria bacterium]|nr:hypothetical protein [Candidatus Eisenbacteria bacterium]
MANHREARSVLIIGALTLVVLAVGLYLGFQPPRSAHTGEHAPRVPDQGPILYEMRSVRSEPDRIRLEWKDVEGASGYRISILSAEDDSLFSSPVLSTTTWVVPPELRPLLTPQTVYHWKLTVIMPDGAMESSEPAAFATQ